MKRIPRIAPEIIALFDERGANLIDVPVLQPADPFLDMAGEDLRRRIFLTESETGEALCLRPEFTIPVCMDHISTHHATPRRYAYLGEVFRQRREGQAEFFQAGIEDLGEPDIAAADARSVADACAVLVRALPGRAFTVTLGDQTVFEAVLAALGLPRGWQKRLARAFGAPEVLAAALADLQMPANGAAALIDAGAGDREALVAQITDAMVEAGISPNAGRTPEEIAARLSEKAELARVRLSEHAFQALRIFLAIRVPLDRAPHALAAFASGARIALDGALENFTRRVEAIEAHGLDPAAITYDAAFGRPLDYYTGLVFEMAEPGNARPLVGGGRYDRLLTLLGAPKPIPAVGFSVWLDRIEALR
ncbi:MAG TPA: ATP phosphoribosyltransferase regulatory subunit [Rhizobiaceae bacterium]|nr:ATP phosphoribosyltransferase regulatory subunit [Rhizobiaceae bacterium]